MACGYGFRARRHSASQTRVNALLAAPRNDGYTSNGTFSPSGSGSSNALSVTDTRL